jgi:hypothetical protein
MREGISPETNETCMKFAAAAIVVAMLTGCASSSGTLTGTPAIGDERGGKLAYSGKIAEANTAIRAHCEQFGKRGMITQMNLTPEGGGSIVFECR